MDKHIYGPSDNVIKDLTNTKIVSQPPHQKKYLGNLIRSFVGLSEEIEFDQYTGVLNDRLLNLSRDEVFEIFFRHASIPELAKALTRDINEDIAKNNQTLSTFKVFLPKKEFWNEFDDNRISLKGVLELLLQTALIET